MGLREFLFGSKPVPQEQEPCCQGRPHQPVNYQCHTGKDNILRFRFDPHSRIMVVDLSGEGKKITLVLLEVNDDKILKGGETP